MWEYLRVTFLIKTFLEAMTATPTNQHSSYNRLLAQKSNGLVHKLVSILVCYWYRGTCMAESDFFLWVYIIPICKIHQNLERISNILVSTKFLLKIRCSSTVLLQCSFQVSLKDYLLTTLKYTQGGTAWHKIYLRGDIP